MLCSFPMQFDKMPDVSSFWLHKSHQFCLKKSFFAIPNPLTDRERCARWITNIGTNKFDIKTYEYSKYRKVCEDHFEPDMHAKVMGYEPTRKLLKPRWLLCQRFSVHRPKPVQRQATKRRIKESNRTQVSL